MNVISFGVMDAVPYTLQDLADLTHIEPRTIRSYIERGLLPGPDTRGRNAGYSAEHLDRLRVLVLLRDAYRNLSLDQARQILLRLTPRQIHDLAEGRLKIGAIVGTDEERPKSSALAYLTDLRRSPDPPAGAAGGRTGADRRSLSADSAKAAALAPVEQVLVALMGIAGGPAPHRSTQSEGWHRITITPDIELSVRDSLAPEQIAQFQRLADLLRVLLTKGVRP